MDRQSCAKLRVLIVGQQNSFAHILATNIQCWGHEVRVLPSAMVMCGDPAWETGSGASEVEGDVLLYDLDESVCISRLTRGRDTCRRRWQGLWRAITCGSPCAPTACAPNHCPE